MALEITASQIYIENPDQSTKFTGDDYLLYQRNYFSTTNQSFGANSVTEREFNLGFNVYGYRFVAIFATVNSADGNASSGLVNLQVPLNGSVYAHLYYTVSGTTTFVDSEFFSAVCTDTTLKAGLFRIDYTRSQEAPRTNINLDLEVYAYDYGA